MIGPILAQPVLKYVYIGGLNDFIWQTIHVLTTLIGKECLRKFVFVLFKYSFRSCPLDPSHKTQSLCNLSMHGGRDRS